MGGICIHSQEQNIMYTTKSIKNTYSNGSVSNFYFSTEHLCKLDAECLVLFTANEFNLRKNPYINKAAPKKSVDIICRSFQSALKNREQINEVVIFTFSAIGMEFNKVCVVFLPEFGNQQSAQRKDRQTADFNISQQLRNCLCKIKQENIRSLIVTEFCSKNLEAIDKCLRQLCEAVLRLNFFQIIVFACINQDYQQLSIKNMRQAQQQMHIEHMHNL